MKRIPLRSMSDPGTAEPAVIEWAGVIRAVIRRPLDQQKGVDVQEIRSGIRVLDALDHANGTLELEDADWEHLCTKTRAMQWAFVDRRILSFIEDVTEPEHADLR